MPRTGRVVLPNTPHHIVQRGHNRDSIFADARDCHYYLANLREWKTTLGCRLYAYCQMTNHIHLIVDPGDNPESLALLMKRVAARQTRFVNALEGRTGSLWEGRYKSSAIETDRYLLACCRYVELNPVRARMVGAPEDYLWSSYRHKVGLAESPVVDLDPCYLAMGGAHRERVARYRRWVAEAIPPGEWRLIRDAVQRGQLTGSQGFVEQVQQRIGRRVAQRGRGRPRRSKNKSVPF
jgi:putative transposase